MVNVKDMVMTQFTFVEKTALILKLLAMEFVHTMTLMTAMESVKILKFLAANFAPEEEY